MKNVLDSFPENERDEIADIWNACEHSPGPARMADESEVDEALSAVHRRLGFEGPEPVPEQPEKGTTVPGLTRRWGRFLAAALFLIMFGAGYFFIPKSVTVPYGETAHLELPDGTIAELNSGSQLWYNRLFPSSGREVHLDGEAYFRVGEGESRFTVHANESVTEVTGTEFNVRSWSSDPFMKSDVTVASGAVHFYPAHAPERFVRLTSGSQSFWNPEMDQPADPEPASLDEAAGWRSGMLIFNEQPLFVILNELERKFNVQIDLENQHLGYETLTTYYSEPERLESILNDICTVKGLHYTETANGFRIYR